MIGGKKFWIEMGVNKYSIHKIGVQCPMMTIVYYMYSIYIL